MGRERIQSNSSLLETVRVALEAQIGKVSFRLRNGKEPETGAEYQLLLIQPLELNMQAMKNLAVDIEEILGPYYDMLQNEFGDITPIVVTD